MKEINNKDDRTIMVIPDGIDKTPFFKVENTEFWDKNPKLLLYTAYSFIEQYIDKINNANTSHKSK